MQQQADFECRGPQVTVQLSMRSVVQFERRFCFNYKFVIDYQIEALCAKFPSFEKHGNPNFPCDAMAALLQLSR